MANSADELRIKYGFAVVIIGLLTVLAVFGLAVFRWSVAADVATAAGSVTGVVGTLVGAFFGAQLGAAGKEKAERERSEAEDKVRVLASALPPEVASRLLNIKL